VDVEKLIGGDHPARAIWALVGRLNLSAFYRAIESCTEEGGRPAFDPQLLISLWVYAYSQGIGSAREVARRCEYDPALQWSSSGCPCGSHLVTRACSLAQISARTCFH
jgi:transposase